MRVHAGPGPRAVFAARVAESLLYTLLFCLLSCGCAARQESRVTQSIHPDYNSLAPRSVAVLPFDNMSPDLDATPLVRPIIAKRLRYKGYDVPPLETVDEVLQEEGVLISHDVHAFTAEELGDMLDVDAVMFGTITDFATKYAFVYASVAVQLRLELVHCQSGEILWQNEQRAAENTAAESILTLLIYHDDLEKGLAVVAASNAVWAALSKFRPYAEKAAAATLASLPAGHKGASPYPWDPEAHDPDAAKALIYRSIILTSPPD